MFDLGSALRRVIEIDGSDLHLKVPAQPLIPHLGHLEPIPDSEDLTPEDTERALRHLLKDHTKLDEFAEEHEVDFSYSLPGLSRFRVNAFRQRGVISLVMRAVPHEIKSIEQLGLPDVVGDIADEERGIILLTGTTGSGKSSTLAAIIDQINRTTAKHIVTIEAPIEFPHRDRRSIINQREVGQDTTSFNRALRRVLRQDPDVILIGEMRDEETVRTALSAASTGHLVLSTIHTVDAAETVNRIIDFFPPHHQQQARVMLAATLRGVVGQRLIRRAGGFGRVAMAEILISTGRVQDLILNPEETGKINEVISEGEFYGMQTFDQALLKAVMAGKIDREVALRFASNPHDFKLLVSSDGQRSTSVEQVLGTGEEEEPAAAGAPANGSGT